MVFSSISFLYIFLPIFLAVYYILDNKFGNAIILSGSIIFYWVGSHEHPIHIVVFLMSIVVNYSIGNIMDQSNEKKFWLGLGIFYNLSILVYFKYTSFFAKEIFGEELKIALPIGISFYSFQAISYLCDVYKRKCDAEKSFVNFGAYLAMFPQLIAGPIVTYSSVLKALHERKKNIQMFISGCRFFVYGLGMKVLIANQIGGMWRQAKMIGFETISIPFAWMAILAYSFQIYFDFYGYSLMAVGLGKMLGFNFPKNFKNPYIATSMTEFWRRWHITLGNWFREYVYIPLGGNRKGRLRTIANLFIVWMLTGIWHGAGYNFVLWGFVLFALISIEKAGLKEWLDKNKLVGHIYMFFAIPLTWAIFVNMDFNQMIIFFKKLFGAIPNENVIFHGDYVKYFNQYGILLFICVLLSTPLARNIIKKLKYSIVEIIVLLGIFIAVSYCLYQGMDDPFLYFQF